MLPQSEEILGDGELTRLGEQMASGKSNSAPADAGLRRPPPVYTACTGEREVDGR
jgi:hypothetical protein